MRAALSSGAERRDGGAHLVFNCQMGRGRTTTGMVAAMLVAGIMSERHRGYISSSSSIVSLDPTQRDHTASSANAPTGCSDTWDGMESDPCLEGA